MILVYVFMFIAMLNPNNTVIAAIAIIVMVIIALALFVLSIVALVFQYYWLCEIHVRQTYKNTFYYSFSLNSKMVYYKTL